MNKLKDKVNKKGDRRHGESKAMIESELEQFRVDLAL